MIRQLTILCMLSTAGSGLYLYTAKHRAELLDREISRTIRAAEAARERTGMLSAEWALVNEPQRLGDLADKYLSLKPMAPTQFVAANDLPAHLPAIMTEAEANPKDTTDDDVAGPPAPNTPIDAANDANPVAPPADPGVMPLPPEAAQIAAAKTPIKPGVKLAVKTPTKKPAHPVALAQHDSDPMHDGPMAHGAPLPLASPQPMRPRVMQAMARPNQYTPRATVVSAVPHFLTQAPYTGSALVHNGALPPPMPLAANAQ